MFTGFRFGIFKYCKVSTSLHCTLVLLLKYMSVQSSSLLNNCTRELCEGRRNQGVFSATSEERSWAGGFEQEAQGVTAEGEWCWNDNIRVHRIIHSCQVTQLESCFRTVNSSTSLLRDREVERCCASNEREGKTGTEINVRFWKWFDELLFTEC